MPFKVSRLRLMVCYSKNFGLTGIFTCYLQMAKTSQRSTKAVNGLEKSNYPGTHPTRNEAKCRVVPKTTQPACQDPHLQRLIVLGTTYLFLAYIKGGSGDRKHPLLNPPTASKQAHIFAPNSGTPTPEP